jgi:hypothetical protein
VGGATVASGQPSAPQNVYVGENGVVTRVFADGAGNAYTVVVTREQGQSTAPILTIAITAPGEATLDWSPDTAGFVLQTSTDVGSNNWTDAASGSTHPVTVDPTEGLMFYRLIQP